MAPTVPTGPPSTATAGDYWQWKDKDEFDHPQSEGWALKYELVGVETLSIVPVFQSSGDYEDYWLTTVSLTDSDVGAGRYRLIGRFVGSGDYASQEYTVYNEVLNVLANPRTASDTDYQTEAEKNLALIDTIIAARLAGDVPESYSVGGRSVQKMSMQELRTFRGQIVAQVEKERSGHMGRRHLATFTRVS